MRRENCDMTANCGVGSMPKDWRRHNAGLIGWSEYNESYGSKGLTAVIMKLAERGCHERGR
jgi:hypothetical protein